MFLLVSCEQYYNINLYAEQITYWDAHAGKGITGTVLVIHVTGTVLLTHVPIVPRMWQTKRPTTTLPHQDSRERM